MIWTLAMAGKLVELINWPATYTSPAPIPDVRGSTAIWGCTRAAWIPALGVKYAMPRIGQHLAVCPAFCVPLGQAAGLRRFAAVVCPTSTSSEPEELSKSERKNASRARSATTVGVPREFAESEPSKSAAQLLPVRWTE